MRIRSSRQLTYWLTPHRLPDAAQRLYRIQAGRRWCQDVAMSREPSGALTSLHATELEAARTRAESTSMRFGGGGNLDLVYDLSEEVGATRVVETGVAFGWSSLAILLSINPRGGHLWSTDMPYPYLDGSDHVGVAVPEHLRHAWTLLRGPDREQLPVALEAAGMIDLAHYDSDKSYDQALWAYRRLFEVLRPGGVLVADDIGDHLAFRDFAVSLHRRPTVIQDGRKFQGVLRK